MRGVEGSGRPFRVFEGIVETRFGALLQAVDERVQLLGGSVGAFQEGVPVEGVDNRFGHATGLPLATHCTSLTRKLLFSPAV